jgi:ADP-ribosylglycohydrolase
MSDVGNGGVDSLTRSRGVFLGAAVGDALGWPQEQRSGIAGGQKQRDVDPLPKFRPWKRSAGTQYQRYTDEVRDGEYSDDTQLLLAVARSVTSTDWYEALTYAELPAWLLYQRGGGGATLRACRSWATGTPPWLETGGRASNQAFSYFQAGGNGVAMRIAPHVVVTRKQSAKELVGRIVLDGITTHGHARALVGAAVYAVALRIMLAQSGTLGYGELLDAVMNESAWQDDEVAMRYLPADWERSYSAIKQQDHHRVEWQETVKEMVDLLSVARRSLDQGSMANDAEVLERLGTFNKRVNGAGTVTAAGALYLSSRTAARPMSGMLRAAFLRSADTDTLGSMTAALLGGLRGHDWLGDLRDQVQDHLYIRDLADQCNERAVRALGNLFNSSRGRVTEAMLRRYRDELGKQGDVERFVDGRSCRILGSQVLKTGGSTRVMRHLLDVEGQSIYVDNVRKGDRVHSTSRNTATGPVVRHVTELVSDLRAIEQFYRVTLKLPVRHTPDGDMVVCDLIRFRSDRHSFVKENLPRGLLFTFIISDLDTVQDQLHSEGIPVYIVGSGSSRTLRVADPAGNDVVLQAFA